MTPCCSGRPFWRNPAGRRHWAGSAIANFGFAFLLVTTIANAQQAGDRQTVALFSLNAAKSGMSTEAVRIVDDQIIRVFENSRQLSITPFSYGFGLDVGQLAESLANARNEPVPRRSAPPTNEIISDADFDLIVGSSIVVVPSVFLYEFSEIGPDEFFVNLSIALDIIDSERLGDGDVADAIDSLRIPASEASAISLLSAITSASDDMAARLMLELRKVEVFRIDPGIIDIGRGNVLVELGRNVGVQKGDEFKLIGSESDVDGPISVGLIIVKEVNENHSFGRIIHSDRSLETGDRLELVERAGFDTSGYVRVIFGAVGGFQELGLAAMFGVRQSTSRGFYTFRPFAGFEIPIDVSVFETPDGVSLLSLDLVGITTNIYLGGELDWYLGRFQIVPAAAVGIAFAVPLTEEEAVSITHLGGFVQATLSYLISERFRIGIDLGYTAWFAPWGGVTYVGLTLGSGITYKY